MPNRILKESICTSREVDNLTAEEERFFYRLIVACDDYGRMDARLPLLRAKCFPLKIDTVKDADIDKWLNALIVQNLIIIYVVNDEPYLQMATWEKHQQVRAKRSKFPAPADNLQADDINCNQMQSNVPVIQSNPYPNPSRNPTPAAAINFYEQNIGLLTPLVDEKIQYWISDTEEPLVLLALEKAVFAGKRNFSYAEGILKNWIGQDIKTRKAAELADLEFKRKREKAKDPPTFSPALYTDDFTVSEEDRQANHERIKALAKNIGKGIGE